MNQPALSFAFFGVLAALALGSPAAFAVRDCEFNGKPIDTNNGAATAGKTGMVQCKDRDSGRMEREYELRNGDSVGLSRYFRNGKLASLRCGPKPQLAPHVDDGKLCGFGAPSTVNTYAYQGALRSTSLLVAGIAQKSTNFFANGKPETEEALQGSQRSESYFAEDGVKRREKLWDISSRPAVLLREVEFHASGTRVVERNYSITETNGRKRSRLANESNFYLNGQPKSKDVYTLDGSTELRDTQQFNDQGKLTRQGRYALEGRYNERPVGVHQVWFANGKPEEEDTYDAKGNLARQKLWDETGKLISDDALFEDGSRKAYAK